MMPPLLSVLFLCLSVSAENIAESGGRVTLECSSAGCPSSIEGYAGMYLFKDLKEREDVLFYHSNNKVTPGKRYKDRIQTNGSMKNHTITISKLTVDDTGVYSCVYKKIQRNPVRCSVYTLFVAGHQISGLPYVTRLIPTRAEPSEGGVVCKPQKLGVPQHPPSTEVPCVLANEKSPFLVLIIIASCVISTLVTTIFILLILRVKQWTSSRGTRGVPQVSNDYVYEVMTKNGLRPLGAPEHTSPSPYNFA